MSNISYKFFFITGRCKIPTVKTLIVCKLGFRNMHEDWNLMIFWLWYNCWLTTPSAARYIVLSVTNKSRHSGIPDGRSLRTRFDDWRVYEKITAPLKSLFCLLFAVCNFWSVHRILRSWENYFPRPYGTEAFNLIIFKPYLHLFIHHQYCTRKLLQSSIYVQIFIYSVCDFFLIVRRHCLS